MNFIINENFSWMAYNILLAFIPVLLAQLFLEIKNPIMKAIIFIGWFFFVPNTIYLFTDILHFLRQIDGLNFFDTLVLMTQYAVLIIAGFLTYILSMYPIEKKLKLSHSVIIIINLLIGFGVVLGRVYRLNSWDVIIALEKVIYTTIQTITSPEMVLLAVLFGLFANFMYFLFRRKTVKYVFKLKKKI